MDNDAATQQQDHRDAFIRVPHFGEKPMRKKGTLYRTRPTETYVKQKTLFFLSTERG